MLFSPVLHYIHLALAAFSLAVLLLLPSTAGAAGGVRRRQRLALREPEHVALFGGGPYFARSPPPGACSSGGRHADVRVQAELQQERRVVRGGDLPGPDEPHGARVRPRGGHAVADLQYESGYFYIADAYMRLMRVGSDGGEATVLADGSTGSLAVDQVTGVVYFTRMVTTTSTTTGGDDSSTPTGRVMKYDPRTDRVTVLQSGVTNFHGRISIGSGADGLTSCTRDFSLAIK